MCPAESTNIGLTPLDLRAMLAQNAKDEDKAKTLDPFIVTGTRDAGLIAETLYMNQHAIGQQLRDATNQSIAFAITVPVFTIPSITKPSVAPNSADCAKLKAQLKQASEIRDRNSGSFNKGGTYEGYLPEGLTTEEKVGLGALIAGVGNGGFGLVVDNLAAKNGRTLAAYGAQYFNRVSPGFAQTVGRFGLGLSGVGFVFDAKGLVEASNSGNEAATALGVFNVSADAVAVALGGPVGVGIGAAQLGLNVYALQQDRINRRETKAADPMGSGR